MVIIYIFTREGNVMDLSKAVIFAGLCWGIGWLVETLTRGVRAQVFDRYVGRMISEAKTDVQVLRSLRRELLVEIMRHLGSTQGDDEAQSSHILAELVEQENQSLQSTLDDARYEIDALRRIYIAVNPELLAEIEDQSLRSSLDDARYALDELRARLP